MNPGAEGPVAGDGAARRRPPAALGALLAALAAWGGWLIFRSSFVLGGRRVFCLFDDAMISMAYARNLVEGHGLNWARRGAPVEGFTHPLWTALMVPVNLLPLPLDRRPLLMQIVCLALLLLNVVLVRRLVRRHFTLPGGGSWLPAAVLTAFYYPLALWSLLGMETGLQVVLITAQVLAALDIVHGRRNRHLALWGLGAVAVLLRLDMLLVVIVVQLYVLAGGGLRVGERSAAGGEAERRGVAGGGGEAGRPGVAGVGGEASRPRVAAAGGEAARRGVAGAALRHPDWLIGLLLLLLSLIAYGAFRWRYFHDVLPNTYYLKLAGIPLAVRLLKGLSVLLDTCRAHGPLLLAIALGTLPQLFPVSRRRLLLPALLFALGCAYSVYVGGDAWEDDVRANRFVAVVMPMVFVLFNALINQALAALRLRPWWTPLPRRLAVAAATAAALLLANGLWLQEDAQDNWRTFAGIYRPLHTDKYEEILHQLEALRRIADPGAAVAVTWAGITSYFSDFQMVDELGYNDRHIAHGPPAAELGEDNFDRFVPGHAKWDMAYVLDEQRPDALLQLWGGRPSVLALRARGYRRIGDLWVAPASPHIHLPPTVPGAASAAEPAAEPTADDGDEPAPPAEDPPSRHARPASHGDPGAGSGED